MGIQNLEKEEKKEKKEETKCKSYITAPKGLFPCIVGVTWETSYTYIYEYVLIHIGVGSSSFIH